jgi:hypothetical protein
VNRESFFDFYWLPAVVCSLFLIAQAMSKPPAKVQQKKNNTVSEIALTAGLYLKSIVSPPMC